MLKLSEADKEKIFAEDLAEIGDSQVRIFTEDMLKTLPWYFWTQPASTTGKYHPACTLGKSGLLIHTKRVIFFGKKLIRAHGWEMYTDLPDRLMSAFILHDGQKGGKGYGPFLVQERSGPLVQIPVHFTEVAKEILTIIKYHMGPWTPESVPAKPLSNYTELELIMYHADYMATQKDLATPADNALEEMELTYVEEMPV